MSKIGYIINPKDIDEISLGKYFDRLHRAFKTQLATYKKPKIIQTIEQLNVIAIPIVEQNINKTSKFILIKKYNQVKNLLKDNNIDIVILGKNFINHDAFKTILKNESIYICNLKVHNIFYGHILDRIGALANLEIPKLNVGIIMNNINSLNFEIVKDIANRVKFLSILSINKEEFSNVVTELYDDLGVSIKLSSNPKVGIKECDIILNFDGTQEFFDMCGIKGKSIIVNFQHPLKLRKPRFTGIMINGINFNNPKGYESIKYDLDFRYLVQGLTLADCNKNLESLGLEEALKLVDKFKIKNFIGLNGVINNSDFNI